MFRARPAGPASEVDRDDRQVGVSRRQGRVAVLLLAAIIALLCAGCGGAKTTATNSAAAIGFNGKQIGKLSTPGTPKGEQTIAIQVIAQTGAQRSALALVPVYIDEHGPFLFALDTGASRSLISSALAHKLHLPEMGSAGVLSGIAGSSRAVNIRVDNWRAGNVPLPPTLVAAMLPSSKEGNQPAEPSHGHSRVTGPVGLLGSDVMSRYGKIAVDYDKSLLILDPPVR
jgi:Aspartyl protease